MTDNICALCKQPKEKGESASITQWVSVCRCDFAIPAEQQLSIQICRQCGKRINKGREGSITQFVFRFDTCSCNIPSDMKEKFEAAKHSTDSVFNIEPEFEEEDGLDLDANSFPIDRYKPVSLLGTGAVGTVYLAFDLLLKKKVAVKILRISSDQHVVSFQEEAKANSKLEHSGIVQILDFGLTESSTPFMVLEYVPGISLHALVKENGPLTWQEAVPIFRGIIQALSYAHANGIFHRDIQPGNVLLTEDSPTKPKLIDFGLAKVFEETLEEKTDTESQGATLAGTPLYMSPDQSLNRPYDQRSEIYSLGCVLFEALSGRPPFSAENPLALLSMHAEASPPRISDLLNLPEETPDEIKVPEELEKTVLKCLEKDPSKRFQSMDEFEKALTSSIEGNLSKDSTNKEISSSKSHFKLNQLAQSIGLIAIAGAIIYSFLPKTETQKNTNKRPSLDSIEIFDNIGIPDPEARKKFIQQFDPEARDLQIKAVLADPSFVYLKRCNKLNTLDLSTNVITDVATSYIQSPYLTTLRIQNTSVKTLEHVSKMTSLDTLIAGDSLIDSDAIKRLVKLKDLRVLSIKKTKVDDSVIPTIKKFKWLIWFDCLDTQLSEKGKEELRKARPALSVGSELSITERDVHQYQNYLKSKQFLKASKIARNSIKIIQDKQGKDAPVQCTYLIRLADCLYKLKKKESFTLIDRAIELAQKYNNKLFLRMALTNKSENLSSMKQWQSSIESVDKAIKVSMDRDGLSPYLFRLYHTKSFALFHLKKYNEAEQVCRKLLEVREKIDGKAFINNTSHVRFAAYAWTLLGQIYYKRKKYDEAKKYFESSIACWNDASKEFKRKSAKEISYRFTELSMISAKKNNFQEAINYQTEAINIMKKFNRIPERDSLKYLNDYKKALEASKRTNNK